MSPTQENTDLIQAQALRFWQENALIRYFEADQKFFLARVTPGAGKTYWALLVAREEWDRGRICRVVVVVPNIGIKKQWIEKAPELVGIKLADFDDWDNTCHGIVTTYQQVASKASTEALKGYCSEQPTLVIFDEIHHASDKNTWGERIVSALGGAKIILGLTGTPFRSDGKAVPFVRYEADYCQPDFSYTYPEALADDIVRSLYFQVHDGTTNWQREGQEAMGEILGQASRRDLSAALGSALDPSSNFVRSMIEGAHTKLLEMPAGSAGLLVAKDTKHADALAAVIQDVTSVKPWVIHSGPESTGGAKKLDAFKESGDQWLVSVRMVSEGVDIPRIRVICWMTNYMTQLYFEQLIARGLRGPRREECWVVIPNHPDLIRMSFAATDADIPKLAEPDEDSKGGGGSRKVLGIEYLGADGYLSKVFSPISRDNRSDVYDSEAMGQHMQKKGEYHYTRYRSDEEYKKKVLENSARHHRARQLNDPDYLERRRANSKARDKESIAILNAKQYKRLSSDHDYKAKKSEANRLRYAKLKSEPGYQEKLRTSYAKFRSDPEKVERKNAARKQKYHAKKLAEQQAANG